MSMSADQAISLREAISLMGSEGVQWVASEAAYQRSARSSGFIAVGGVTVPISKVHGRWTMSRQALEGAIRTARTHDEEAARALEAADHAYSNHSLVDGGAKLSGGGYHVLGDFHFVWSDYQRIRMRSNGFWRCNRCWEPAQTEHDRPECHRCSDWNGCGEDCTLSRVLCNDCGTSLSI